MPCGLAISLVPLAIVEGRGFLPSLPDSTLPLLGHRHTLATLHGGAAIVIVLLHFLGTWYLPYLSF